MTGKLCKRDHPRTCGEKINVQVKRIKRRGSPPHMRGKATFRSSSIIDWGITPAHAGKRLRGAYGGLYAGDHPRTCGEKLNLTPEQGPFLGSPPHMRGKVGRSMFRAPRTGITPAHAGKSPLCKGYICAIWDHPRTCGEKWLHTSVSPRPLGSPPHMRGKAAHDANKRESGRDHPRTCGEKAAGGGGVTLAEGSPPHMRGKAHRPHFLAHSWGITPAHAGKSLRQHVGRAGIGDHPRTCGEKKNRQAPVSSAKGSPPHMRGKAKMGRVSPPLSGITPAHAGKSESAIPSAIF